MDCKTCERRKKRGVGCQVFKSKPKACWAWTDDKQWLKKVVAAVTEYAGRFDSRYDNRGYRGDES